MSRESVSIVLVAVGTTIAGRPPHRSVRAELPHTAPTLDEWRRSARLGKGAGFEDVVSIVRRSGECASNLDGCAGCDGLASTATDRTTGCEIALTPAGFQELHGNGNSH